MDRHFYKGLKFKITLVFSVVFMTINVIFTSLSYHYFKDAYTSSYNKYLYTRAQIILNRTEINPDLIAMPDSGESIRVFYHNNQHQPITVFQSPGIISKLDIPYQSGVTDSLGQHGVYLKKEDYDGHPVELLLTVSNAPLVHKFQQLSLLTILATLVSVLLSAISAYLSAGWLLKPIRLIAKQATKINTSQLNTRLNVSQTHDELQQLTETINAMIDRIAHEQEVQNNFFAAASHELRTPLANLQAETELHLNHQPNGGNRQLLVSQLQEITRLQHIVEQFLLISQFKHKGLVLHKTTSDLSDQLLKVFSRNQIAAAQRQIKTAIHFSNDIQNLNVSGDRDKLEVVWQNLLQNALKHAVSNSTVACNVEQAGNSFKIMFENSIFANNLPTENLMEVFVTNHSLTSGTGLGLWISKQILEAHGGTMSLSAIDHKFRVQITLPIV